LTKDEYTDDKIDEFSTYSKMGEFSKYFGTKVSNFIVYNTYRRKKTYILYFCLSFFLSSLSFFVVVFVETIFLKR